MSEGILSKDGILAYLWTRATGHRLIRDRAAPWWVIVTTMFGIMTLVANYSPLLLYLYLKAKGYPVDEWTFPISLGYISVMMDWVSRLALILIIYGAIEFLVDWYMPWQFRKNEEPRDTIPLEAQTMPKKGDDTWL